MYALFGRLTVLKIIKYIARYNICRQLVNPICLWYTFSDLLDISTLGKLHFFELNFCRITISSYLLLINCTHVPFVEPVFERNIVVSETFDEFLEIMVSFLWECTRNRKSLLYILFNQNTNQKGHKYKLCVCVVVIVVWIDFFVFVFVVFLFFVFFFCFFCSMYCETCV